MGKQVLAFVVAMICLVPFVGSMAEAKARSASRQQVEVRYRNAGERIANRAVNRILDKVFGQDQTDRSQPREMAAHVRGSLSVEPGYSVFSLREAVVKGLPSEGYRVDAYTGRVDITAVLVEKMAPFGITCISYAQARENPGRYPGTFLFRVREYNDKRVSLEFSFEDARLGRETERYTGQVSVPDMDGEEKERAVLAIMDDFVNRVAREG